MLNSVLYYQIFYSKSFYRMFKQVLKFGFIALLEFDLK